jgi:phage-related protein
MQMGGSVVILHSFIKKTHATPVADLKLARKRPKEVKNG